MSDPQNRIAQLRKKKKMSQQQLADAIGAHVVTVSNLERGQLALTSEWARKIATALQVEYDAISLKARPRTLYIGGRINAANCDFFEEDQSLLEAEVGIDEAEDITEDIPRWLVVTDDSLYPVFRKNDVVRAVVMVPTNRAEVEKCFNKLCMVTDRASGDWVGFLGPGDAPDRVSIAPINKPVKTDVFPLFLCLLDQAFYQPKLPPAELLSQRRIGNSFRTRQKLVQKRD